MKKALIIIDVQNDFLSNGSLEVPHGDEIIPIINALQPHFDHVIATKDWHPPHHVSFAKIHGKKTGEKITKKGVQDLWPVHCVQGTKGAEWPSELAHDHILHVFLKGTHPDVDSYSAFFDNARLYSTGLSDYLKEKGINEVYLVGLATEYCVMASAKDAVECGFRTFVIKEGCGGIELNPGDIKKAYQKMESFGVTIVHSKDFF